MEARPQGLQVTDLTKTFGATRALDSVDLGVEQGEIRALLGSNGSGKSTLIKIIAGYHTADPGGRIQLNGDDLLHRSAGSRYLAGARFVHQDLGLSTRDSILDNFGMTQGYPTRWGAIKSRVALDSVREALAQVDIDVDPRTPVERLSPAERSGVAVARALVGLSPRGALLVLDEPTATLHHREVDRLLSITRSIASRGAAVLYVTHRLDEVFKLCHSVTVLRDGVRVVDAPVPSVTADDLVRHLVGNADRAPAQPQGQRPARRDGQTSVPTLLVQSLTTNRLDRVDVSVEAGQILGIAGLTGSGREDICPAIFGAITPQAGEVAVAGRAVGLGRPRLALRAGVGYMPPDRHLHGGMMTMSARENLSITDLRPLTGRLGVLRLRAERAVARDWFARMKVQPSKAIEQNLDTFSGGNQQKILLAKWLRRSPKVLLLDEPTQGVDINAKRHIHNQLIDAAEQGTAVILSSSDVEELAAIAHEVIVLSNGRVVSRLRRPHLSTEDIVRASVDDGREADR